MSSDEDLEDIANLLGIRSSMSNHIIDMYAYIGRLELRKNKNHDLSPQELHDHIIEILSELMNHTYRDTLASMDVGNSSVH